MRSEPFNLYFPAGDIKSSYVEEIIMNENGSDIGFTLGKTRNE